MIMKTATEKGVKSIAFAPFTEGAYGVEHNLWLKSTQTAFVSVLDYLKFQETSIQVWHLATRSPPLPISFQANLFTIIGREICIRNERGS